MTESVAKLKSWQELLATALEEESQDTTSSTNRKTQQMSDSLRVDLFIEEPTNPQQIPPVEQKSPLEGSGIPHAGIPPVGQRCFIKGCLDWPIDICYCARHRALADEGTLWSATPVEREEDDSLS